MTSKTLVAVMIILLAISCLSSLNYVEESTASSVLPKFYVDDDYDSSTPGWQIDHFDKIQDAIDNAALGDRILVYEGTYYENLIIDKELDLFGEDRDTTIIDANNSGDVVTISAERVNVSHFTIKESGSSETNATLKINSGYSIITDNIISDGEQGISMNNCDYNTIYDNIIRSNDGNGIQLNLSDNNDITYNTVTSNGNGMFLYSSSDNEIENNVIQDNTLNGVFLNETSNNNQITNNNISDNTKNGIYLNDHCNYNTIQSDEIHSNTGSGVRLENSSINTINGNTINSNTEYGIMIVGSANVIQQNTISFNSEHGMFLFGDDNNTISDNTISGNTNDGLRLYNSTNDSIYRNEIHDNTGYGINLDYFTKDNLISNNYFHDNTGNAMDKSNIMNNWNISKKLGTNKISGPYLGGNYWDDYTGSDSDGDGLGETAYTIYAGNKDESPLVDINSPVITNVGVSPSSQAKGSYVYISATVTDNIAVDDVFLIVTYPGSVTLNFSIGQNKTGNTFYCNKIYPTVGTYTFYLKAKDARNNWDVSTLYNTFTIHEGVPPTIVDNSPTTGSPSGTFAFNATVTDDEDSASSLTVTIHYSHGDLEDTLPLSNFMGNFFGWEITLDNSTTDLKYYFYASDSWGNSVTTDEKTVSIVDNELPEIKINKYGPSFDALPNSYTFNTKITDNEEVSDVTIEYWYDTDSSHITAGMDNIGNNYYEKVIIPDESVGWVYCIIYASDPSGNQNDTKNPFVKINGPYIGFVTKEVTFNASGSYDLDGSIESYSWTFGDGASGTGINPTHTYSTTGTYPITLTVADNDDRTSTKTTYVVIYPFIQVKTSYATMNQVANKYNLTLSDLFYCYDTDGDSVVDTFVDPNSILKAVHTSYVDINGDLVFLLSVDDTLPEFMWNATVDEVVSIEHIEGVINTTIVDEESNSAVVNVNVNKTSGWIYLDVKDNFTDGTLTVKANDVLISLDRVWRKDGRIYVLDDPETNYTFIFEDIYSAVESPTFVPVDGGLINEDSKTITISYNVQVSIVYAAFGSLDIKSDLVTSDNKVFTYTPLPYLENGTYTLEIDAQALYGSSFDSSSATYIYYAYESPPEPPQESFIEKNWLWLFLGGIGATGVALLLIRRYRGILFESFIYIKNRKIIPFFKPVVFGPVSIDVNDERVNKAEFYVDGSLKDTITEAPYVWRWNEKAFMKHTIETKVYDQDGNSSSSGEMTFYVFNSPRFFK